ncbi:hypothetical protein BD289DRAFT_195295 [Coniella lustricola]|uniref:Uncharacterized protein n=1 Tax=Coniella lustricola TaxID=2025994 RepID=A0A2T3AM79_9PEZI|nr:hypothetical protein BD289DRAFT_195295 [Coniella lustricola]
MVQYHDTLHRHHYFPLFPCLPLAHIVLIILSGARQPIVMLHTQPIETPHINSHTQPSKQTSIQTTNGPNKLTCVHTHTHTHTLIGKHSSIKHPHLLTSSTNDNTMAKFLERVLLALICPCVKLQFPCSLLALCFSIRFPSFPYFFFSSAEIPSNMQRHLFFPLKSLRQSHLLPI